MNLKSRSVFKNIPGVFLLLFVVVAVFIPLGEAKALDLISFDIFSSLTEWTAKLLKGDSVVMTTIYWFAYRVISLGLYFTTVLVYFGSWLVDVFLDEDIYASVLNMNDSTSAVAIGWRTVRDACNTFFILFLLVIAFSTILRIQAYSAKSLLPKLIISLFLINFSAVIAMMVIDLGQVFMFEIKTWMGAGGFSAPSGAGSPLTTIVDYFHNEYGLHEPPPSGAYLMSDVVGVMFAVAYSAILGLLYIMLALFLMVRIIVFVILIIISPFAFFSMILPGMRTYTSQWWQSLVSHAIFGPVFLFFIFLASKMAQSMQTFNSTVPEPADMEPLSYIIAKLIPHIVAMGMLMAAIPVTQKLGVAGANKFIGGAAGIGKIGIGAVAGAKLAGGFGKKVGAPITRRSGVPDKMRRGTDNIKGSIAENKWAQKAGISKIILRGDSNKFSSQRDQVEKEKKGWINSAQKDNLYGELKNSKGKSSAEIAAIIERMSEKKMLNEKDLKSHKIEGQTLSNILSRAKPALDADKLKESMPQWAAIVEAGPGKGKENIIKGRTKEITTEMVEENKLSSLNNAALESADVMKTIFDQHDDPDKWLSSQSTARQDSANIGLENLLKKYQKEIHNEGVGGVDFNNVNNAAIGHANPIGNTGMDGDKLRKEIDSIQKSLAKNDKNGHEKLNRPTILANGEIDIDLTTGRIDFAGAPIPVAGTPEHTAWESRRKETAEGMKGETGFKYKSREFYEDMGQYLAKAQLDTLRKSGNTEQMRAAKDSILSRGARVGHVSTASPEIRSYVSVGGNTYYENL